MFIQYKSVCIEIREKKMYMYFSTFVPKYVLVIVKNNFGLVI